MEYWGAGGLKYHELAFCLADLIAGSERDFDLF